MVSCQGREHFEAYVRKELLRPRQREETDKKPKRERREKEKAINIESEEKRGREGEREPKQTARLIRSCPSRGSCCSTCMVGTGSWVGEARTQVIENIVFYTHKEFRGCRKKIK